MTKHHRVNAQTQSTEFRKAEFCLADAWEEQAQSWVSWAREPGHDSYWRFHRDQFFELLPESPQRIADVGCGEGRVARDLKQLGHKVIGLDASPTLIKFARQADPEGEYHIANARALPLADGSVDLAIAFMSLQDVDDLEGAVCEIARCLKTSGNVLIAIVHPINSSGLFEGDDADSPFVIRKSYLSRFRYSDTISRDGIEMTFHSEHRSLEVYSRSLEKAGLAITALREHPVPDLAIHGDGLSRRWQHLPLFLHIKATKLE